MFDFAAHGLIETPVRRPLPGGGADTVGAILDRHLEWQPGRLALVGRSGRFTYAELDVQVALAAAVLHELGVRRYDRVAACLPNDVDIVIALLACARLGAIWVGINRPLAAPEKALLLVDSGASVYLTDVEGAAEIAPERAALDTLQHLMNVDEGHGAQSWREHLDQADPVHCPEVDVDSFDPAAIAYTSGTTGHPKGAVHSHHNVLLPGAIAAFEGRFGADCPQGVMLPLTILNLMVLAPLTAFQDGSTCVCIDSVRPRDIARWVKQESVGHFASVPTIIQDLLTSPEVDPADLATLGHPDIGGAGIAKSFQTLYRERFGRCMTVAYGMTEAPTIVTKTDPDREPEEELCGRAVAQVDIVIVDNNDRALPTGEIGEICVRPAAGGPYAQVYATMLGYWNRADETAKALAGGMYHSGDLGYLDDGGQLFIRGRTKELIIRGGANVYPAEIERVLVSHPLVADAAVLGVPDERLGERVVAAVELVPGVDQQSPRELEEGLFELCASQIARYKVPAAIRVVSALPRNAMNKVIKPQLRTLFS
ncbi:MAG: class I adenylate-forming enzyme family protein [Halioglobus sp.]|nr:class I adenylate-forming enzyme family protein [Halioglobus sp.]